MQPTVAVISHPLMSAPQSDGLRMLDEERVLPPQLQSPEVLSGVFLYPTPLLPFIPRIPILPTSFFSGFPIGPLSHANRRPIAPQKRPD